MSHHNNIFYVFGRYPHPDEKSDDTHHQLLGKFWLKDGNFSVLEDHGMIGKPLDGLTPGRISDVVNRLANSQRRMVVSAEDLKNGEHPELLPSITNPRSIPGSLHEALNNQFNPPKEQESHFDYHRTGMPAPQHLEIRGTAAHLDGHPLRPEELQAVWNNVKKGKATLRHKVQESGALTKMEPHLAQALNQVKRAVQAGHLHPDAHKALNRALFTDTLVPSMGNRMAYKDFLSRPREGVHVHIDGADFGTINKTYDHPTGDTAIVATGKAIRSALDESVGRKHAKAFRPHGDEFSVFVPTHENAMLFARTLRAKLEAIPAIRGTHRLSVNMGWGMSPNDAEEALKSAKALKKAQNKPPGQAETTWSHRMPPKEGP